MLLLTAVLLGAAAEAIRFNGPRATPLAFVDNEAVADFLAVPSAAPTAPPQLNNELVRRAGTTLFFAPDNTCGYLTGDSDIAYTCNNADAQCAISTPSANTGYIGCCDNGNCAGYHADCVDREAYSSSSACGSSCRADTLTLKCTSSDTPYCNSVSINGGNLKVYGYYCNNEVISTMQALYTTYDGQTDGRSFTASVVTDAGSATETASFGGDGSPETTSLASNGGIATSTGPSSSTTSPTSNNGDGGGKKSNTGAIVGGVVGGVGGILLIVFIVIFVMRRRRNRQPPQVVGGAPAPGVPGAPGGHGYGMAQINTPPPPGGYYNQQPPAPNQPTYYHQSGEPQQYYPGPGAAAAGVSVVGLPDRAGSASPLKPDPNGSGSPQLGHDYRMSSVSTVTNSNYGNQTGPISPQTTGKTAVSSPVGGAPGTPGSPHVPATIHEAAGKAVGTPDYNADHRGEMAELA